MASAAFSTTPLLKAEVLTASNFFSMTAWYWGRLSLSWATCLPITAPRPMRMAKASATASRTEATFPILRRLSAAVTGAKTKLNSTAMAIGTSTSRAKYSPSTMAATMMTVSVASARLPRSARAPANGLKASAGLSRLTSGMERPREMKARHHCSAPFTLNVGGDVWFSP